MGIPIAKAYVTKDNRIISILDGLEEEIKGKLILSESGVQKISGRCCKQNRLDFLKVAFELSKQIDHHHSDDEVLFFIEQATKFENE